jgi:hypothetical protein
MYQTTITADHLALLEPLEGVTVAPVYSGRYMYGQTCFGLITDDPLSTVIQFTRALLEADVRDASALTEVLDALAHDVRQDQMGTQAIVYWPHIQVAAVECQVCGCGFDIPEEAPLALTQRRGIAVCLGCAEAYDAMETA